MPEPENLDATLRRIRGLLDKASHPGTPEAEADVSRAHAEKLMIKFAIEEAALDASRPAAARMVPEKIKIEICRGDNPIAKQLGSLISYIASHCRCRVIFTNYCGQWAPAGQMSADAVGYPSDLRYLELLFTTLMLDMTSHVEPEVDPAKSFDANVHLLHESGVKWVRIATLMNRAYEEYQANSTEIDGEEVAPKWRKAVRESKKQPGVLVPWPDGHRLINAYRRHCELIGEEPRAIVSPVSYQRNFAEGYVNRVATRLWKMREAAPTIAGTALALRSDVVDAAYEEFFPNSKSIKHKQQAAWDENAQRRGREAGDKADLSGGRNKTSDGSRKALPSS